MNECLVAKFFWAVILFLNLVNNAGLLFVYFVTSVLPRLADDLKNFLLLKMPFDLPLL